MSKFIIVFMLMLLAPVSSVFAGVPQQVNYQGRLTDDAGVPLTGTYDLVFKIHETSDAFEFLWEEAHAMVPVEDGLFAVILGSINSIPDSVFDGTGRYLGIAVNGGSELLPRTPMISAPYAYRAVNADTADYARTGPGGTAGGWVDDGSVVRLSSPEDRVGIGTSTPSEPLVVGKDLGEANGDYIVIGNDTPDRWSGLKLGEDADNHAQIIWGNNQNDLSIVTREAGVFQDAITITSGKMGIGESSPTATLDIDGSAHISDTLLVGPPGQIGVKLSEDQSPSITAGIVHVMRNAAVPGISMYGDFANGQPTLYMSGDDLHVRFDLGSLGDHSVELPSSSINSVEMFNEPGVANSATKTTVILELNFKTIRSRQCTFPSSGYVVAIATCQVNTWLDGVHGEGIFLGIGDTPGEAPEYQYYKTYLVNEACCQHVTPVTIQRFFEVSAETKTFFFQGSCTNNLTQIPVSDLTIMFFPTAYGLINPSAQTSGDETEYSQATGNAPMEDLIEERVRLQIDNIKTRYDVELADLRQTNDLLMRRLEAIEARVDR